MVIGVTLMLILAACGTGEETSSEPEASEGPGESTAAEPSEATAWEPEYVDGVLQPLPDGFPNQEITLINADDAASADGLYVRLMQEIMNDGLSPVQINIVDLGA
jgi:hypothetical protein